MLKWRGFWGEAFIVALVWALLVLYAHATTTAKQSNAFGAVIYQDNPNAYLMGTVSGATVAHIGSRSLLVLEVRPTNTYQMFSQQLQLCGGFSDDLYEKLAGAVERREVIIFTYSRLRHKQDCNDLYRIDKVAETASPLPQ